MKVLRLDLIGLYQAGITLHPQEYMKSLGYKYTNSQPEPIGDCWFFEVDEIKEPLPPALTVSGYNFEKHEEVEMKEPVLHKDINWDNISVMVNGKKVEGVTAIKYQLEMSDEDVEPHKLNKMDTHNTTGFLTMTRTDSGRSKIYKNGTVVKKLRLPRKRKKQVNKYLNNYYHNIETRGISFAIRNVLFNSLFDDYYANQIRKGFEELDRKGVKVKLTNMKLESPN